MWTYYGHGHGELPPADDARALERLHAGMRQIDLATRHFTDRVADAQRVVADRDLSPELVEPDRELLSSTLSRLSISIRGSDGGEQLLHGEPIRVTCSTLGMGRALWTSRPAAVGRWSSTLRMPPKKWRGTIR